MLSLAAVKGVGRSGVGVKVGVLAVEMPKVDSLKPISPSMISGEQVPPWAIVWQGVALVSSLQVTSFSSVLTEEAIEAQAVVEFFMQN